MPFRSKAYARTWVAAMRKNNPERKQLLAKISHERVKSRIFLLYGNSCNICGYNDPRAFNLDHKFRPSGKIDVSKFIRGYKLYRDILNGKEDWLKYQLLCANCNHIKRIENNESSW